MPKIISPLAEKTIRAAKPLEREYRLFDGNGLYLIIKPSGSKVWRTKYRFQGKENTLSFGSYPNVSLDEARQLNIEVRNQVAHGINPSVARREIRARETAVRIAGECQPSVRICMDGMIEIWKGRAVIRFTKDESLFLSDLLARLG